jgi:hypothetical protein
MTVRPMDLAYALRILALVHTSFSDKIAPFMIQDSHWRGSQRTLAERPICRRRGGGVAPSRKATA